MIFDNPLSLMIGGAVTSSLIAIGPAFVVAALTIILLLRRARPCNPNPSMSEAIELRVIFLGYLGCVCRRIHFYMLPNYGALYLVEN